MSEPPRLTDRPALAAHRRRALHRDGDWFLHRQVAAEIKERLAEVNKSFRAPALVCALPGIWEQRIGGFSGWRIEPEAPVLTLEPGAHDLVVHAMSLHWADDPVGQLVQCRRALAPDGLFLGVMPGGNTLATLRTALAEAEVEVAGGLSPRVLPMGEIRDLGALLQRAGLSMPVADSVTFDLSYASLAALVADLRDAGETNALAARHRRIPSRRLFSRAEALLRQAGAPGGGRMAVAVELIFLTGWAPAPDQPRPLRPGSAQARLADALGVREHGTGDPVLPRDPNRA